MSMIEAIRRIVASQIKPDILIGTVTEFDSTKWLVTVKLNNGAEVDEVRIKSVINNEESGIFVEPKMGSYVLVGIIEGKIESLFIIGFSEIEKFKVRATNIELNGDQFGGIVKLQELEQNLNTLKDYVTALKSATSSGLAAVGVGTAASGTTGQSTFNASMLGQTINFQNMENETVKHG